MIYLRPISLFAMMLICPAILAEDVSFPNDLMRFMHVSGQSSSGWATCRIVHLELTNPKMPVIKNGKIPKGSGYKMEEWGSEGHRVTAPGAAYLWEEGAADKKVACDIQAYVD